VGVHEEADRVMSMEVAIMGERELVVHVGGKEGGREGRKEGGSK